MLPVLAPVVVELEASLDGFVSVDWPSDPELAGVDGLSDPELDARESVR